MILSGFLHEVSSYRFFLYFCFSFTASWYVRKVFFIRRCFYFLLVSALFVATVTKPTKVRSRLSDQVGSGEPSEDGETVQTPLNLNSTDNPLTVVVLGCRLSVELGNTGYDYLCL